MHTPESNLRGGFEQYVPRGFPINSYPLIASFWDDVNIKKFGSIFYRETTNKTSLQMVQDKLMLLPLAENFSSTILFLVTWDGVAKYDGGKEVRHLTNDLHDDTRRLAHERKSICFHNIM